MCNTLTGLCIKLSRLELYGTKEGEMSHTRQTRTIKRRTHRRLTEMGDHYGLTYDYANTRISTRF